MKTNFTIVKGSKGEFFSIPKKVDIIWNITTICGWDCAVCCVDANHVTKKDKLITIKTGSLSETHVIPFAEEQGSIYDQAATWKQKQGLELTLEGKLRILKNLHGFDVKLDISGGDPLSVIENTVVLREASRQLGKKNVTLTATGAGLSKANVEEIASYIGELNFTFDSDDCTGKISRPNHYAEGNLKKAIKFAQIGVNTRAELPLTTNNISEETLENIYVALHHFGIKKLLLMRLFPVGRGIFRIADTPSPEQYRKAIDFLRELENRYGSPQVKLQCALKHFDNAQLSSNPCDLFQESFGLMSDGTLLTSPWAINSKGQPIDDSWVLGNLRTDTLMNILTTPKAQQYAERSNDNFGHCKIFSFIYSQALNPMERIFDKSDPLYSTEVIV